jgi:hypothetical protein
MEAAFQTGMKLSSAFFQPHDDGLRLVLGAQSELSAIDPTHRDAPQRLLARIANCLVEIGGGVSVCTAEEILHTAHNLAIECAARVETSGNPRARVYTDSLVLLLRERLDAVRAHRRTTLVPRLLLH